MDPNKLVIDDPSIISKKQIMEAKKKYTENLIRNELRNKATLNGLVGEFEDLFNEMEEGVIANIKIPKSYQKKKKKNKVPKIKYATYTQQNINNVLQMYHKTHNLVGMVIHGFRGFDNFKLVFPNNKEKAYNYFVKNMVSDPSTDPYCLSLDEDTTYSILFHPKQKTLPSIVVKHVQRVKGNKTTIGEIMGSIQIEPHWKGITINTSNQTQLAFTNCTHPIFLLQMGKSTQSNTVGNLQDKMTNVLAEKDNESVLKIMQSDKTLNPSTTGPFIIEEDKVIGLKAYDTDLDEKNNMSNKNPIKF